MASVRCTVSLLANRSRKVDIELRKEKDKKLSWQLMRSAGGNLSLPVSKGNAEVIAETLTLWEHNSARKIKELVMLVVFNIKPNFMDDIINNGTKIETEEAGLYNDNPSERDVAVKLARLN